ncbi:MAG TPA: AAA family ATPase [Hyphomicrobium sp.]|nr:AAA family ATPase [Hyphomicrobium sp.]
MSSPIIPVELEAVYSDALGVGPGRLRRVVTLMEACGAQALPLPDAIELMESALWCGGALPADTQAQRRAWNATTKRGEDAYEVAALAALPNMASEAVEASGGDPVEALRVVTDRAKWFADDHQIVAAVREALAVPVLHGALELVDACRKAKDTDALAADLRSELADFSDLWASRDAKEVLAGLPENEDFAEALISRHPFLRPENAREITGRMLRRLSETPQETRETVVSENPFSERSSPPSPDAWLVHEKAKGMLSRLASPAHDSRTQPTARHNPNTGALDLRRRLRTVDIDDRATFDPPNWLIKGVAPRAGIGLLYGESGAGKTFLAIHAAMSVAWGLPFFGQRTKQGGVLYIAAEGGSGVLPRFRAARQALNGAILAAGLVRGPDTPPVARAPLRVVTECPNLSRDGDPKALLTTIEDAANDFAAAGQRLALVVVDTWHAAMGGGDENSAADAGAALAPLRLAAETHDALVLVVHHPGKDTERGARGSNALPAAADTILALSVPGHTGAAAKPANAVRRATVTKLRDGDVGADFSYRLPIVTLGTDEDGDPWTTCVVDPVIPPKLDDDGLSAGDREFMGVLQVASEESGSARVRVREARLRFYAGRRDAKPDALRKAFRRALDDAVKAGRIGVDADEEWVWLIVSGHADQEA